MKIYIASSWKNQHAVQMLTHFLRQDGLEVLSFVENNHGEQKGHAACDETGKPIPFDEWVESERGQKSFDYDTNGATGSDLVIYIGPSGTDAWAEVGAAWGVGVPILGLWAKGEQARLMRKMVWWFDDWAVLLNHIRETWLYENGRPSQKEAAKKIKECNGPHPDVLRHWQELRYNEALFRKFSLEE